MLVADYAFQVVHRFDAGTHTWKEGESVPVNPEGSFGVVNLGDMNVSPVLDEVYVADFRDSRYFRLSGDPSSVDAFPLTGNPAIPAVGLNPIKILVDRDNPVHLYFLCQGGNEVIKTDVAGTLLSYVRMKVLVDPSTFFPAWSMDLNLIRQEACVVMNPGPFGDGDGSAELSSMIFAFPMGNLGGPGERSFRAGSSIWDLVVWQDGPYAGRYAYAADSYRGEVLIIDLEMETELKGCAIRTESCFFAGQEDPQACSGVGARILLQDPLRNRLYVGNWSPGYVDVIE
jgi:hypothetical protein